MTAIDRALALLADAEAASQCNLAALSAIQRARAELRGVSSVTHGEAQLLHELIGAAIEAEDYTGLRRARELASLVVSDTDDDELSAA